MIFSAYALAKTEVFVIPQKHLKTIINNSDPFVTHIFKSWPNLTGRFMAKLNKEVELIKKIEKPNKLEKNFILK